MTEMKIQTEDGKVMTANLYEKDAPHTCDAFLAALPMHMELFHAMYAGDEIFTMEGPLLDIPLENATNELDIGEIGVYAFSPRWSRGWSKAFKGGLVIVYGSANLMRCCNVFAQFNKSDLETLKKVGTRMWKNGSEAFTFLKG